MKRATFTDSRNIAGEMVAQAYAEKNTDRVLSGAGFRNPYHTMFAIEGVIKNNKMSTTDGLAMLGGDKNLVNLYEAYRTETASGRAAIDKKLKDNNYFEGKVGPLFKNIHTTIQSVVANPEISGTEENLVTEYDKLFGKKTPSPLSGRDVPETLKTEVEKPVETVMSVVPLPPKSSTGKVNQFEASQRSAYQVLLKGEKRVQKIEAKLGRLKPTDAVFDMLSIRKERASKEFENLYKQYMDNYGPASE